MEQNQMTISKTSVELYRVRHSSGMYWADITVDSNEKAGRIQIASDFGSWQNFWGACGRSFKEFLTGLNMEYAAGKFGADKHFDCEGTLNSFRHSIKESQDAGYLKKKDADKLEIEIASLADYSHEQEFICELKQLDGLMRYFEGGPPICRTVTPGFKRFWDNLWPVFIQQLKQEADYCEECKLPYSSDFKITGNFPRPTDADLQSPLYNALFNVVKGWKGIRVPGVYTGTFDGDGKHAKILFDSIFHLSVPLPPPGSIERARMLSKNMPYTADPLIPGSSAG